jgi:hypothetical protein
VSEATGIVPCADQQLAGATQSRSAPYIASPGYDAFFIILAPAIALAIAEVLSLFEAPFEVTDFFGTQERRILIWIGIWTYAHLVAVGFRSHGNRDVYAQHRFRFTVVPLVVFLGLGASTWVFVTGFALAALWDVYHTSMQNFGFCRIYDAKAGNRAEEGRLLDVWMNHVIYIGPILGGLSLLPTLEALAGYESLGWSAPIEFMAFVRASASEIRLAVITAGTLFMLYYAYGYSRLIRRGYTVSRQKLALLFTTGATSIYAWGFLPPLEAFFIANLFHGLQYFAIVWWMEQRNIRRVFGLSRWRAGKWLALVAFAISTGLFGVVYQLDNGYQIRWLGAAAITVSLMHFWYDGFVWSVRKKQIG